MKYEKKNNIGFLLMLGGTALIALSLILFTQTFMIIGLIVAIGMVGSGLYMMTRGFTDLDKDHPDYNRYQEMKRERDGQ